MTTTDIAPTATTTWEQRAADLAARIAPYAPVHDRDGTFAREAFDALQTEGFTGASVPTEFGGGGATHAETGDILREIAKGCPSTAVALSMHYHLVATQIWRDNHGQPAEAVLRKVADGAVLISTGANDWIDSNGTATKVDGGFRITARKSPCSGAPAGTVLVASAAWPDAPDGPHVVHCSIPFAAEGISIETTWDAMGLRGSGSDTVVIDDVFVPDAAVSLVRPAGSWHPVWSAVLGSAMPLISAAYLGVAEAAAAQATEHGATRVDDHMLHGLVGELTNNLMTARDAVTAMFVASNDLRFDATPEHTATTLARKTNAAEACIATVRSALDICGGSGFAVPTGLERLYRDVHGALHHPLPAPKQRVFTGRVQLGLAPID